MKSNQQALVLSIVLTLSFGAVSAEAKPGGTYKGTAKGNATTPQGGEPMTFADVPVRVRLPNKKGKVTGILSTSAAGLGGDVAITGKVKKYIDRQGGKKRTYKGKWSWALGSAGFPGTASGSFSLNVKKSGRKSYKFSPAERVNVKGAGAAFTYNSKLFVKK